MVSEHRIRREAAGSRLTELSKTGKGTNELRPVSRIKPLHKTLLARHCNAYCHSFFFDIFDMITLYLLHTVRVPEAKLPP